MSVSIASTSSTPVWKGTSCSTTRGGQTFCAAMTRMEKAGRSIVEAVEANPEKAKQVRRFANYYLPDAVNVLQQYAKLAKQGVRGENAAAIRTEVEHNAASIATAFENQLDALYAAESMDLSADITVLQSMLKGQGLS